MTAPLVRGHPPVDPPTAIIPYASLTTGAAPQAALLGLEALLGLDAMCNTEEQPEGMHQLMQKLQL